MCTQDSAGNEIFSAITSHLWLWGARLSGLLTEFKNGRSSVSHQSLSEKRPVMSPWLMPFRSWAFASTEQRVSITLPGV